MDQKIKDIKHQIYKDGKFVAVYPIDEILEMLRCKFEHLQGYIESLEEENKELKDKAYSKRKLAEMKAKLEEVKENSRRGFSISKEQSESISEWKAKHMEEIHGAKTLNQRLRLNGVSGGRWQYEFIPTSIGTIGRCVCSSCIERARKEAGDMSDINDYRERLRKIIKEYDAEYIFQDII